MASVLIEPKVEIVYTDAPRPRGHQAAQRHSRYERDAPHKHFVTDHHSIVFGEGDPRGKLMFIGEAPARMRTRASCRPFVGRSGQLLNKMIEAFGLKRENVYIANILKTRPPNNATPTLEECSAAPVSL